MPDFISEDDLDTFEGWLRYQAVDIATATPDELAMWRGYFDQAKERSSTRVGLMKLKPLVLGEYRYAVAVREGSDLWLTLWVLRSRKGEIFVMKPHGECKWNLHASYHLNGRVNVKSSARLRLKQNRQPLTPTFRGTEPLFAAGGYQPKRVGAICDPAAFSGIVEVPPGVLGPAHGTVAVDLVEPGFEPISLSSNPLVRQDFRETIPWIVIRVFA